MDTGNKKDSYCMLFPKEFFWVYNRTCPMVKEIYEIRIRCGAPVSVETAKGRFYAGKDELVRKVENTPYMKIQDVQLWLQHLCRHSMYAFRDELIQGFFTVCGGHRIGVVGQVVRSEEGEENVKYISSINIRIAHEVIGCASSILPKLFEGKRFCSTLIASPPMCGKTTLLRDLIRCISDGIYLNQPMKVGVIDERGEIAACYMGEAQNHVGLHTDVYTNCRKSEGVFRLLRSMSPQVIAMDEFAGAEEAEAIEKAFFMGCTMLATVHASGISGILSNRELAHLISINRFERIVVLERIQEFHASVYDIREISRFREEVSRDV